MAEETDKTRSWNEHTSGSTRVSSPLPPQPTTSTQAPSSHYTSTWPTLDRLLSTAKATGEQPSASASYANQHVLDDSLLRPTLPPLNTSQSHSSREQLPPLAIDEISRKRRRVEPLRSGDMLERTSLAYSSEARVPAVLPTSPKHFPYSLGSRSPSGSRAAAQPPQSMWAPQATQPSRDCCKPGCQGSTCSKLRSIVQELVTEICSRDPLASGAKSHVDHPPPKSIEPESSEIDTGDALDWALQRLRWNNVSLKTLLTSDVAQRPQPPSEDFHRSSPTINPFERMKRQHESVDKESEGFAQQPQRSYQNYADTSSQVSAFSHEPWRTLEGMDPPGFHRSSHHRSSSIPYGPAQASPNPSLQAAARRLPSPSSLNLPIPGMAPISSPSPSQGPQSAQLAHLQDLQHQVSVKQLALQTLQREYESLLQKLERQRIKAQALEKKFEVSDAEINSLTDEKERLAAQVLTLEAQVEELQTSRDEARKMNAESTAQYMKIMEMAGKIQGKGVDDRKAWDQERQLLQQRITELETERFRTGTSERPATFVPKQIAADMPSMRGDNRDTSTLEAEVRSLRIRISALDKALKEALEESKIIREAAIKLASAGQRLEISANKALSEGMQSEQQPG